LNDEVPQNLDGSWHLNNVLMPERIRSRPKRLPKSYTELATGLASIGTFGGGITFGLLLTFSCTDVLIKQLLAYASILFIGTLLVSIPVRLAVHSLPEQNEVKLAVRFFLRWQLALAGIMACVALVLMLTIIFELGHRGAFYFAIVLLGVIVACSALALIVGRECRFSEALLQRIRGKERRCCFAYFLFITILLLIIGVVFTAKHDEKFHGSSRCKPAVATLSLLR